MIDATQLEQDRAIARELRRAWPAFFDRFGRLTQVQRSSIPSIFEGRNTLVLAATASGKTEAACAPLIERNLDSTWPWTILYVSPTRALVNDLYERLSLPMQRLGLSLRRRTGDHRDQQAGANVLLTTPESFDSLLCRGRSADPQGHVLANAVAVVLDEVHLLHGSARGEQVRWLLERLRRLRAQAMRDGWARSERVQVVALSATIPQPATVLASYLPDGLLVQVPGARSIETVVADADQPTVEEALPAYICSLDQPEKILVFCNSRKRVDDLAAGLRPLIEEMGFQVRAHHGSLDRGEREDTEQVLRISQKVVVVSTSTLELGIDIGDIDLVVLDGPAPDMRALLQRIGRGNRRTRQTRVMTCAGSFLETLVQSSMIEAASLGWLGDTLNGTQFAVARQQVASYIFQSPRRSRARATVTSLLDACLPGVDVASLLDTMIGEDDLIEDGSGLRLGAEWLNRATSGSIHSNIEDVPGLEIVDEQTGRTIVRGLRFQSGQGLRAGGLLLQARRWSDQKIEVRRVKESAHAHGDWGYTSRAWLMGADQPQSVRRYLAIAQHTWPLVRVGSHLYVFHFGGARVKTLLEVMASVRRPNAQPIVINEWYLRLDGSTTRKPSWIESPNSWDLDSALAEMLPRLERDLARPRANVHLPVALRLAEVRSWLRVEEGIREAIQSDWAHLTDGDTKLVLDELIDAVTRSGRASG